MKIYMRVAIIALAMGTHSIQCMNALKKKQGDVAADRLERVDAFGYAAEPNLNQTHPQMEDTYHVEQTAGYAFYGLYDGHGGDYVANYAADHVHKNFDLAYNATKNVEQSLKQAFLKTHADLGTDKRVQHTGCTATVAVISGNQLFVANAGDSRTVLYSAGKAIPLSVDHKLERSDEKKRMIAAGGAYLFEGNIRLGVSRSLGDKASAPFIIPDAEIQSKILAPEDEFLILASDGVWDVLSNEQACTLVKATLGMPAGSPNTLADAARTIVDAAIKRGTKDNVSAIVVDLQKNRIMEHMKQAMKQTQEPQAKSLWEYLYSFFWSK